MTEPDLSSLLETAEKAARAAGARLLAGTDDYRKVNAEFAHDVKLQADVESEKLIRDIFTEEADYPVIGEEEGGDADLINRCEPYWVIDPLDGTYNYLRDLPLTCVSIGLLSGQKSLLGVIYDFYRDELFTGIPRAGNGLQINGSKHEPNWADSIKKATIATGFPANADRSTPALDKLNAMVQSFKKIRMLGTAAIAMTYVAAGRVDAYYENGVNLWDIAAGMALVEAAGGIVELTPVAGKSLSYEIWVAGSRDFIL